MKIIGTGRANPAKIVTNAMLEEFLDTSDEWIRERTGMTERHVISNEKLEDLAAEAARKAIEDAGITPEDIDYIICSNVVNEYITPGLSCIIQGAIGAKCACVDVNAACSGFIYALDMADDRIKSGKAKTILVVAAEEPTRMVDWKDRSICVLFGDGAGAAVVTEGDALICSRLTTVSKTECLHYVRTLEPTPYITKQEESKPMFMNGREVFKTAVLSSSRDIRTLLDKAGLQPGDIKYYILHQANMRIIEAVAHRMEVPMEKVLVDIQHYGNTSAGTLPLCIWDFEEKLKKGDNIIFTAFGAGFTWGAVYVKWGYDGKKQ